MTKHELTTNDWAFLARDLAELTSTFVSHHLPELEGAGTRWNLESDGTVTGLALLHHVPTGETVGLVLSQSSPGEASYAVAEVFTTHPSGNSAVPTGVLEAAGKVATATLNQEALAYSFAFEGTRQGGWSDYAWSPAHVAEKVKQQLPTGCRQVGPVAVSNQKNSAEALVVSHKLNKRAGLLFGGVPYSELESLL
jgi:hypothetical protein